MLIRGRIVQHHRSLLFNILIICSLLSACSSTPRTAPVSERTQPPSERINFHIVAPGETLYSIAWRYGKDYRSLARINGVDHNYLIFPGQKLILSTVGGAKKPTRTTPNRVVTRSPVREAPQPKRPSSPKVTSSKAVVEPPKKSTKVVSNPAPKSQNRSKKEPPKPKAPIAKKPNQQRIYWRWPAKGKVVTNFSGPGGLNKGIDIQGKKGEPVFAAAAGNVVYAGSGLRGYGKLVIIKHNDIYLSAYAHNHRLRVKEGDTVSQGQHIADVGSSGTDRDKLHFEIRRDGKPVNPVRYLPKRKS